MFEPKFVVVTRMKRTVSSVVSLLTAFIFVWGLEKGMYVSSKKAAIGILES